MHEENAFVILWFSSNIFIHRGVFIAVMYITEFGGTVAIFSYYILTVRASSWVSRFQ